MSFIAERIIFIYVGMDAMDIDLWKYVKLRSRNAPSLLGCLGFSGFLGFGISGFQDFSSLRVWDSGVSGLSFLLPADFFCTPVRGEADVFRV